MLYVKNNKSIALMSFALPFLQGSSIPWASFSNERKKLKELDSVTPSQKWGGGSEEEWKVQKKTITHCYLFLGTMYLFVWKVWHYRGCCISCEVYEGSITDTYMELSVSKKLGRTASLSSWNLSRFYIFIFQ